MPQVQPAAATRPLPSSAATPVSAARFVAEPSPHARSMPRKRAPVMRGGHMSRRRGPMSGASPVGLIRSSTPTQRACGGPHSSPRSNACFRAVATLVATMPVLPVIARRTGSIQRCLQDFLEWAVPVSNQRPPACKAGALPTELTALGAPSGIRTRATALKGPRPGPLVDGGGRPRIAAAAAGPPQRRSYTRQGAVSSVGRAGDF